MHAGPPFRQIFEGERCVFPGSVYDAISARVTEGLGFETGMFAGSIGSFTVLGAPSSCR
jgi:carboxyvinyl-carboxyphosphonate phosphorylmutase